GQTVSQRDTFVGILGEWGRLKGGRLTIPFKEAKGGFDLFNDLQGELGKIIDGEERLDNVLQYDSRRLLGPLAITLAIVPGENPDKEDEDGPADGVSGSLVFSRKQLYMSVGFNVDIKQQDQLRLIGGWRWDALGSGSLDVGALYQRSKVSGSEIDFIDGEDKANAYGLSAAYALQRNTFKAQYIVSDRSMLRSDASQVSLAVDHKLGKRSVLYGYYTRRNADEERQRNRYAAIGLKHSF
ncbi:MAG: porin, partial [Pseudomonadales bacterium]|nr:porin [Pseudomonadales bacterium]